MVQSTNQKQVSMKVVSRNSFATVTDQGPPRGRLTDM